MKNKKEFKIRYGIRARLLTFSLGLTLLSIAAVVYVTISSIQAAGTHAQQESEASLRTQTEDFLLSQIVEIAGQDNLLFERVGQDAENLAKFTANLFDNPSAFAQDAYWNATDHMFVGPDGQYMNGEKDLSTVFIPNTVTINDKYIQDLELSSYLDMIFPSIYSNNPNTAAVYLITKNDVTRLYPNISLGTIIPGDYIATDDIFFTIGAPQNNPERNVVWTPVYNDPAGQGLLVSAIAPIYTSRNQFIGVIGIDVSLTGLTTKIEEQKLTSGGYSLLVDQNGQALALPNQGYIDILGRERESDEYAPDLNDALSVFLPIVNNMKVGETEFQTVTVGEKELFVVYAPLTSTGWVRVNVFEAGKILESASLLQTELDSTTRSLISTQILPTGLGIVIVMVILGIVLTNRLVNPIRDLAEGAQRIGAGDWDAPLPKGGQDEIGLLSNSFHEMAIQLRNSVQDLEQRVAERTKALEVSSEIGRRLTSILDPRQLAGAVVNEVQSTYNYYYAQIYLFDEAGENLVLTAGTGEAGVEMMKRGHRLPKGRGLVGRAAETKESVLVSDTSQDPNWLPNELLPDTKAEAVVPIVVGDRVLGVLDVQDSVTNDITDSDIALLESLAGQVAISLQNARQYQQAQSLREQYTLAIEGSNDGIWDWDIVTNNVYFSPRWKAMVGYDENELNNGFADFEALLHPEDHDRALAHVNDYLTGKTNAYDIEFRFHHKNGTYRWIRARGKALRKADGTPYRMAGSHTDITESKESQESIAKRAREQELLNAVTQKIQSTTHIEEAMQVAARELGRALGQKPTMVTLEPTMGSEK